MPLPKAPERPASSVDLKTTALAKQVSGGRRTQPKANPVSEPTPAAAIAARGESAGRQPGADTRQPDEIAPTVRVPYEKSPQTARKNGNAALLMEAKAGRSSGRRRQKSAGDVRRLFVLDTNVLMHDPSCLFRFEEHDVYLPIVTLEELDNHKRGASEVNRNVRQISRSLDALLTGSAQGIENGISLALNGEKAGRLYVQNKSMDFKLPDVLPANKADNIILAVVAALKQERHDREVVLVSKDINMRIKASMLGLLAEDYFNDQVIEDSDLMAPGATELPPDFWDRAGEIESWQDNGSTFYRLTGDIIDSLRLNEFVFFDGEMPLNARVVERTPRHALLRTTRDFSNPKNAVWGITARNREQEFALNLLTDPQIDFVSLLGQAGTGKTLLALAAGLQQVLDANRYTEIIVTRATVPVGDDIGFLPGTEEEKMQPWMGALEDNLEVLNGSQEGGDWGRASSSEVLQSKIRIKSLSFMRGRTFTKKYLIIDEAQNLTPKQMKTLITRAGSGTKVVCLGNVGQIDTPYLTEASSGLTFVVERMRGWAHAGHITLARGERSRLADYAADIL
ncbi:MAG: PhoH family protein [Burkholderiaceae bacterium]